MAEKRDLCDYCGQEITKRFCHSYCSKECCDLDTESDDELEFEACSECDGHDACEDFGCAIKMGLGHLLEPDNF